VSRPPVVFEYQRALDQFRSGTSAPASLLKRMSELISLLDLTTMLGSDLSSSEILDAALLSVMGELQTSRGVLFVRDVSGRYRVKAARGLRPGSPSEACFPHLAEDRVAGRESGGEVFDAFGLELLSPIFKAGRLIAVLGLGPRTGGSAFGTEDEAFVRSVAACAATPIENGLMYEELKRLNHKLNVKVFQLHNLFDISRELTASFDDGQIEALVATTLMGHLMVSRCAVYLREPEGLVLAHSRGVRSEDGEGPIRPDEADGALAGLRAAAPVSDLPPGSLRDRLESARMALVVPLFRGSRVRGLIAVGERASGVSFSEEDGEFAVTLGRQAVAALENARLLRVQLEKQRQDRELQIAREIQQSLFPSRRPEAAGFDIAAESHPCFQVGGDYYDFIPLAGGRLAFAVADVSGKGTPASILMASVHASLKALAGTAPPGAVLDRLNRFLFESTQANKYVTLFYGEFDPPSRRLDYVNAGHVPPYWLRAGGEVRRLTRGGPALGLLDGVAFEQDGVALDGGDLVAAVTDGATEAASPADEEFGDERVVAALRGASGETAGGAVRSLVEAVVAWTGTAGCSDDLTALVLKAR
jgi:phosphoserine phosphatase RsbU/P